MKLDIKKLRDFQNLYKESSRDFAKRIGVSHAWYYEILARNKNGNPSFKTIETIAKNLNIDPRDLILFKN